MGPPADRVGSPQSAVELRRPGSDTRYNYDRWEGAALVEGEAVAVEVDQTSDIIGLTVQGLLIGAIAGIAVAFILGFSDARKEAAAA